MREHIVAGNWKMNMDLAETEDLISAIKAQYVKELDVKLIVAPPHTNLYPAFQALRETPIEVSAQNMHQSDSGAFTGEISAKMFKPKEVEPAEAEVEVQAEPKAETEAETMEA